MISSRPPALRATLLIVISACSFGSLTTVTLLALQTGMSLVNVIFWRFSIAAVLLAAITWRVRKEHLFHKEFGFQVIDNFIKAAAAYGHPDSAPKLIGKGITVMLSPLPRNKRAKNPKQDGEAPMKTSDQAGPEDDGAPVHVPIIEGDGEPSDAFSNNPFAELDIKVKE